MGRLGRGHKCCRFNSLSCCCGAVKRGTAWSCRPPRPTCVSNDCLHQWRTILPPKFFKNIRRRNLRRIEPKENDDGELTELEDTKDEEGDDTEAPVSKFAGKKKGKAKKDGSNNALSASSFDLLGERDDEDNEPKENDDGELTELEDTKDEEGDDTEALVSKFAGKKKGKAKKDGSNNALSASSFGLLGEGDDEDNEDSGITKRILIMKNQDAEVAGFAPCEKQITELLKVGKDERAPKAAKRKLGTHKRAKKREEMAFVLWNMRAAGGGEKM